MAAAHPRIVLLLAAGLLVGPVTGVLEPDDLFGELLFPTVSLAVAVVLFEGALGLGLHGIFASNPVIGAFALANTARRSIFSDDVFEGVRLDDAAAFLAMTPNDELNASATRRGAAVTGRSRVYQTIRDAIPLFVVDGRGEIDVVACDHPRVPRPGETLVTLGPARARKAAP